MHQTLLNCPYLSSGSFILCSDMLADVFLSTFSTQQELFELNFFFFPCSDTYLNIDTTSGINI